jgi:hypothetical protein
MVLVGVLQQVGPVFVIRAGQDQRAVFQSGLALWREFPPTATEMVSAVGLLGTQVVLANRGGVETIVALEFASATNAKMVASALFLEPL